MIHDAADHEFARSLAITEALPVGCHLNVPLRLSDGTVYGSFCCLSRAPDRSMTERDMGMVRAFAALAVEQIESDLQGDMRRDSLRATISQVIAGRQLAIFLQPIHDLATGEPAGVECLARFPDARERGPDRWFNEAGEVGLGVDLEMLAVRCALETLPGIPESKYVSINASPEVILSGELAEALRGAPGDRLVVEVTEHQRVDDFAGLAAALRGLDGLARIAIDDVGAGYAGLRHIVDLSPDILKLDMSLTRDIHRDPARRALTGAMVQFAGEIGASLVAEGVECAEESVVLERAGVTYGQGYHFSRPLPVVRAQQYLMGVPSGDIEDEIPPLQSRDPDPSTARIARDARKRA